MYGINGNKLSNELRRQVHHPIIYIVGYKNYADGPIVAINVNDLSGIVVTLQQIARQHFCYAIVLGLVAKL
ncbi:uncharacterized protein PHALS_14686 [Plasmopara halstedii]|uniref:Uncharacterized protein n=1 Tax=Plasmopara halstedii TaxID=4781 RepID=A0A0P1APA8_PLAHL|nr:uncharacterized protein PHALS_14686 [Plasmopara halstedii]CEG43113.1 hypothetical protein PHALS_14686 [Plasmopara halstedii]|eukprot:XP_024579482.1 hypothetical protein PHALS_14686 [Plasmopara halstedii]